MEDTNEMDPEVFARQRAQQREPTSDWHYTLEEQRVVNYLKKITPEIGAGTDPIGFLIASHASLGQSRTPAEDGLLRIRGSIRGAIRDSLRARLEGRNEGGDTEVMRLVDELEKKAYRRGFDDASPQQSETE